MTLSDLGFHAVGDCECKPRWIFELFAISAISCKQIHLIEVVVSSLDKCSSGIWRTCRQATTVPCVLWNNLLNAEKTNMSPFSFANAVTIAMAAPTPSTLLHLLKAIKASMTPTLIRYAA